MEELQFKNTYTTLPCEKKQQENQRQDFEHQPSCVEHSGRHLQEFLLQLHVPNVQYL
jgi:hypothetical protein